MKLRAITVFATITGVSVIIGFPQPACATEISESDIRNLQQLVLRQQEQINAQAGQIKVLSEKLDRVLGYEIISNNSIEVNQDVEGSISPAGSIPSTGICSLRMTSTR